MSQRYKPTCFVRSDAKVYHRIGDVCWMDERLHFMTDCGKAIDDTWGIKSIDRRRATLLGRPCRRCFPVKEGL